MALLSVQGLGFAYQQNRALDNISFELERGEILAFLGLNGAGKSTALNLISGVLPINEGSVRIYGHDLAREPKAAKAYLGYLPEQPPLYPRMRVRAYLRFAGQLRGLQGQDLDLALDWVLGRCGLESVADKWVKHLSQGFRQRLGIAQAIIHRPALILLDEPSVGLDPQQRRESLDLIRDLAQDHALIFSTHILSEVQAVASHVQILHAGCLRLSKTALAEQAKPSILLGISQNLSPDLQKALQALPDVLALHAEAEGYWRVEYAPEQDYKRLAKRLSQWAAQAGLGLFALQMAKNDLERIFLQTTQASAA